MHRGPRQNETPKNFKLTIVKLISYLGSFKYFILIAIILASLSSVLSIIGPNKLSDLADEISNGIMIDSKNFTKIIETVKNNVSEEKIKEKSMAILSIKLDEDTIRKINTKEDITNESKNEFNAFITETNQDEIIDKLSKLDKKILDIILPETEYNNVKITTDDKIKFIEISSDLNNISKLPESIKRVILDNIKIDNKEISSSDQIELLSVLSDVNQDDINKIYGKLDDLPESIKSLIEPKMNMGKIKNIGLFLLIVYLISAIFNFVQSVIMATVSNNFAQSLRTKILRKINNLPLKYFDKNKFGDILSRVTNDVDTIGMTMNQSFASLVAALTLFLGSVIMMFVTNYIMAITAILSSLIGFVFMFIVLGKSQKYFRARQIELGKLNGHIEEIYSSLNVVKVYNGEEDALNKFNEYNESVFECNRKSQFLSGLMPPMMNFIGNLSYVAVCVVGAILVTNNVITFGVIVAFMVYIRLFSGPLSQIAQGMSSLQSTAAASERVFEFLEEEELEKKDIKKVLDKNKVKGNIEFKHVKFGYDDDKIIIKDFNCKVHSGEKIAIVGPTGAGKTTMVNLLMNFYDINSGDILIDGVSIKDLSRENIHDLFIMVLQDTWLFNGTIRDNIKYNKEDVSDEEIKETCKTVGVHHFIKSLPKGLDYEINDNEAISAGQKQLLTIARGMIKNAPFLILDEATSSVDTRTEELVQIAMDKLTKGRTSFIIAHRLSTIKNADLILVMNDGNIIEQGSHEELMKKKGFYCDLYNSQFKKNA